MRKLGNIAYLKDKKYDELFNLCTDTTIEGNIPTLIVGWSNVQKLYPDKSIIGWKINENTYWTFGKREKRDRFDKDIVEFEKVAIKSLVRQVEYEFIDMLTCDNECKKFINDIINSPDKKTVYLNNNMAYLYSEKHKCVFGISLNDIKYEGFDSKKLISSFSKNNSIDIISNIPFNVKNMFYNHLYVIPYMYSC